MRYQNLNPLTSVIFGLLFSMLLACGEDAQKGKDKGKEDNGSSNGKLFDLGHFEKNPFIENLKPDAALNELGFGGITGGANLGIFFLSLGESRGSYAERGDCSVQKDEIVYDEKNNEVRMMYAADTNECPEDQRPQDRRIRTELFVQYQCSKTNLKHLDQSLASRYMSRELCPEDAQRNVIQQMRNTIEITKESNKAVYEFSFAKMNDESEGCETNISSAGAVSVPQCGQYIKLVIGNGQQSVIYLNEAFVAHKLKGQTGGRYYDSGTVDLTINLWTGKLKFIGADQDPKFTLKYHETSLNDFFPYEEPSENEEEGENEETPAPDLNHASR